jgi:hypothetical protein
MATIANDTQFIGISPTIDLTGKKSAILNEQTIPVTMEDITSTVRPYKVFTALLTQSGGNDAQTIFSGTLVVGTTYLLVGTYAGDDFSNVGGPKIMVDYQYDGTYFVATGTTPNSWTQGTELSYNTGAPVVNVLENTIGNVWFTYNDTGLYSAKSNDLFSLNKTMCSLSSSLFGGGADFNSNLIFYSSVGSNNEINIISSSGGTYTNDQLSNTPIDIRVYE